jgi:hypothetical protein
MAVPVMLNLPVLVVQLPYILASPTKREWIPKGMQPEVWRALSWPFAGILFWWWVGRGIEALRAARRTVVGPRMTLAETVFATLLFCIGVISLAGIITSTPDDRRDIQFLMLIAGGILWGILASFVILARFFQRRIAKRNALAAMST